MHLRVGVPILAVAVALVLASLSSTARAADFLDDMWAEDAAIYKDTVKVVECWDAPRLVTYLLAKDSGQWKRVASARSSSKAGQGPCRKNAYRAIYTWRVNILPKKQGGDRWLQMATSATPYFGRYSYKDKVEVMTASEWRDYVDSLRPDEGDPSPSTPQVPTPPSTPSQPTWSVDNPQTWSQQEVDFVRYLRSAWETSGTANQLYVCRSGADPTQDGASAMFYDSMADQGVRLFSVDRSHARLVGRNFYDVICYAKYGLRQRLV